MSRALALATLSLSAACPAGCPAAAPAPHPREAVLVDLERLEADRRRSIDWRSWSAFADDAPLGADPIHAAARTDGTGFLVALRGANALVLLDASGDEVARRPAPRGARFVWTSGSRVLVAGELDPRPWELTLGGTSLSEALPLAASGGPALVAVAGEPDDADRIYTVDVDGALTVRTRDGAVLQTLQVGPLPRGLLRVGDWLVAMSVAGHRIVAWPVERGAVLERDAVVLRNDGPFWGFDARSVDGALLVAAGHVEDRPLDRTQGSFAFIDSFVRVERLRRGQSPERIAELNLSELGVVTPKAVAFVDDSTVLVAGAGSALAARVTLRDGAAPQVATLPFLPGAAALAIGRPGAAAVTTVAPSPLLDGWIVDGARLVGRAPAPGRSVESHVGEALMFTTAMAPRQSSEGRLSRFTCEACHFEGIVDGRTHHTGRGEIRATTKPLWGLANNTPLFTRALDANLARMVDAEFTVAGAHSPLDPWFTLSPADAPWLALLGVDAPVSPAELRRALVWHLFDFAPLPNPRVVGRRAFTDEERAGAGLFRERCASCHAARLIGSDPRSEVPFAEWEALVLRDNGPLVWSTDGRVHTGIVPEVHSEGARPSSLRRLPSKGPYFTNGTAATLEDVVRRARFGDGAFAHDVTVDAGAAPGTAFTDAEVAQLAAFLRLL